MFFKSSSKGSLQFVPSKGFHNLDILVNVSEITKYLMCVKIYNIGML